MNHDDGFTKPNIALWLSKCKEKVSGSGRLGGAWRRWLSKQSLLTSRVQPPGQAFSQVGVERDENISIKNEQRSQKSKSQQREKPTLMQ